LSIKQNLEKTGEKLAWYTWKKLMLSRKNMNRPFAFKSFTLKQFFKDEWGNDRAFPKLAEKSFNQLWKEKMGL
jgi:L-lactate dehydrogenase complex protein LldF